MSSRCAHFEGWFFFANHVLGCQYLVAVFSSRSLTILCLCSEWNQAIALKNQVQLIYIFNHIWQLNENWNRTIQSDFIDPLTFFVCWYYDSSKDDQNEKSASRKTIKISESNAFDAGTHHRPKCMCAHRMVYQINNEFPLKRNYIKSKSLPWYVLKSSSDWREWESGHGTTLSFSIHRLLSAATGGISRQSLTMHFFHPSGRIRIECTEWAACREHILWLPLQSFACVRKNGAQ